MVALTSAQHVLVAAALSDVRPDGHSCTRCKPTPQQSHLDCCKLLVLEDVICELLPFGVGSRSNFAKLAPLKLNEAATKGNASDNRISYTYTSSEDGKK